MNTLAIDLYKQAIITAYQMLPNDPANPMTTTFQAVVAGTFADLIVAECIALREKIEIVGINSEEYEQGIWDGLKLYQDHIKRHFGVEK
jgi:hypothetical protein